MHACMYVLMYVCMYVCMHVCMHVYECMHVCMKIKRGRQTDRQKHWQKHWQTDRQTGRQRYRQTHWQTDRQTEIKPDHQFLHVLGGWEDGRPELVVFVQDGLLLERREGQHLTPGGEAHGVARRVARTFLKYKKEIFNLTTHSTHFILVLYAVGHMVQDHSKRKPAAATTWINLSMQIISAYTKHTRAHTHTHTHTHTDTHIYIYITSSGKGK